MRPGGEPTLGGRFAPYLSGCREAVESGFGGGGDRIKDLDELSPRQWGNVGHDLPGTGGERIAVLDGVRQTAERGKCESERTRICADEISRTDLRRWRIGDRNRDIV